MKTDVLVHNAIKANSTSAAYLGADLSALGEETVVENIPIVQNTPTYGLVPSNFRQYTSSGGTTGVTDRMFTCSSGTTIFGYGAIQSFRALTYSAGQGGMGRFNALFQNNAANSWSGVGMLSITDEISFGYDGTTFGIWHRYNGAAEVRTITVTTPSSGSTNLTLTLNSVAYTIPLTAGTAAHNTYEIATWLNSNQSVWVADQIDGYLIIAAQSDGPKSGTYSYVHTTSVGTITQNRAGVTKTSVHIPQTNWNGDKFDGTGVSGVTLDPTKGNLYRIDYTSGFGDINFYINNPNTGRYVRVHIIKYGNANTLPSITNPSLRFGMYTASIGSTTNITVQCESVSLFTQGPTVKTRNPRSAEHVQTVPSSATLFYNILTLRNRTTYNYVYNQVEIEPLSLTIVNESNKSAKIRLVTNPTITGSTNFLPAGNNLVSDIDKSLTTISGGTSLGSYSVAPGGAININLKDLAIRIPPSLTLSICANNRGAANDITGTLTYYEDL